MKSNFQLLLNHGFTLPENNENSECVIDINEIPFVCRKNVDKNDKNNNFLNALKYLRKKIIQKKIIYLKSKRKKNYEYFTKYLR